MLSFFKAALVIGQFCLKLILYIYRNEEFSAMPVEKANSISTPFKQNVAYKKKSDVTKSQSKPLFPAAFSGSNIDYTISKIKTKAQVCSFTGFSESFVNEIIKNEGFESDIYKDHGGVKTIGFGHNIDADSAYTLGPSISKEQGFMLLAKDLMKAKTDLRKYIGDVKLEKGQEEALVDLVFNVGIEKVAGSKLISYVKKGQFEKALDEFDFIKINGEINPGLVKRRLKNIKSFCGGKLSPQNKKSIDKLVKKGIDTYDEKIKKSGFFKSIYYGIKKYFYKKSINKFVKNLCKD